VAISIGTSGWVYRDWNGRVYPRGLPQADQLCWYAERFSTVEVNASFYRLPKAETVERWRDQTPDGFEFSLKMSRYVTHIRRLRDAEEGVDRFWTIATRLGAKLGPVLIQLPPTLPADEALLTAFLDTLPGAMRPAFEFRHRSWDTDAIRDRLDRAGAAWVLADRPGARVPLWVTGGWSYVRFHQGRRSSAGYPRTKLRRWADRLAELPVDPVYGYFNNDPGGAAVLDARSLRSMLTDRGLQVRGQDAGFPHHADGNL
jgi:uncharacterized protein YecE (DUF72 family)